ncbi:MAG TPA: indole-3-glycerol phosphate synthase TrpC [Geminicoccaceae bacterium]|nr:indole-3-glycerol phosphate synthase TrpC [Geminicoccus sp.]HMU52963.1 indole-3-glycerol phosphate synthase TrpC [Geminicoccaceae bacterium]
MADVLARIVERKREHVAACRSRRSLASLLAEIPALPPTRGFASALADRSGAGGLALIAEIKKASPSKGLIRADFDPRGLALAYAAGGATCLSVLTDEPYFQGHDSYIALAREAVPLPVLRKDFMIDPYQVAEARHLGADCILLIMACLDDVLARELSDAAHGLGMDVLVEVHDEAELERASAVPSRLIGVNNRNLKTLTIDLATTEALAPRVPPGRLLVAESGLHGHADLERMRRAGAAAFLVGESLMRQADVERATRTLLGLAA